MLLKALWLDKGLDTALIAHKCCLTPYGKNKVDSTDLLLKALWMDKGLIQQ
jgi:hypothetical protein